MKNFILIAASICVMLEACDELQQIPQKALAEKAYKTLDGEVPLIIGHRGAPGYLPDHTIEGYTLAIEQGVDFIEPDLVLTKDSVLICRHEPMLSGTTNVSQLPEFASRKTTKLVDGVPYEDWFAGDFTFAEIKTLRAIQPMPQRPHNYDGMFHIPAFEEVIALTKAKSIEKGRTIGIYPETKHPSFHEKDLKLPLTDKVLEALRKAGWDKKSSPVFLQSFEVSNLQYARKKSDIKIVQLLDADDVDKDGKLIMKAPYDRPYDFTLCGDKRTFYDLSTDKGLKFVKTYADGIGPWKPYIQPYNSNSELLAATDLIERAHKHGLLVHAYTFRNESKYLLKDYNNNPAAEYKHFFDLGIDGVFSDFPETAVASK